MSRSLKPFFSALALFVAVQSTSAYALESHLLIDPDGEHNADFFGTSAAWAGDVNGHTHAGTIAPAGVYFARLEFAGRTETRKITLLK